MWRIFRICQIIKIINKTRKMRASITNLNKRNCLWVHSTETCMLNPPVVIKIQRRGLEKEITGIEDELGVEKYYALLRLINKVYACESEFLPCVTFLRRNAGFTASALIQNITLSSKSAIRFLSLSEEYINSFSIASWSRLSSSLRK